MPRKTKETDIDVTACRVDSYQAHFQYRQFARNHGRREEIAKLVKTLPTPKLTIYGASSINGKCFAANPTRDVMDFYSLGHRLGLEDPECLMHWYWTDEGWQEFERHWQALPEFVNIPMCTTDRVVHIRTQDEFCDPAGQP